MNNKKMKSHKYALIIHGGAGNILKDMFSEAIENEYRSVLLAVIEQGRSLLENGCTSVETVESCIKMLEDTPLFNAGKGAVFTHEGTQEMDASLMDGKTLDAGAVSGLVSVKNPISAARKVLEASEHVYLSGSGALQFATEQGLTLESADYFWNEQRWHQLKQAQKHDQSILDHDGTTERKASEFICPGVYDKFGTVGAVALDIHGNLAAGTSTGGMTNKKYGRIGDSPIVGSGTYANNATCAVSCTGHGEFFLRNVVAYDVSALMEYRAINLKEAADYVIHKKLPRINGAGGLIAVDKDGQIAMPFNTSGMYRAFVQSKRPAKVMIFENE